jgi:DNA-binding transcriptional MerR regulator
VTGNGYSVGGVANLTHVSVGTLHHYDAIGLLRPSARSGAGHRCYAESDLHRLREILFYRKLGFGLDKIATILADPCAGTADHLRAQHRLLRERIKLAHMLIGTTASSSSSAAPVSVYRTVVMNASRRSCRSIRPSSVSCFGARVSLLWCSRP